MTTPTRPSNQPPTHDNTLLAGWPVTLTSEQVSWLGATAAQIENGFAVLEQELAEAKAEIEKLRAALAPFASLCLWPDDAGDEINKMVRSEEDWDEADNDNTLDDTFLRRGDIRAARKALGDGR